MGLNRRLRVILPVQVGFCGPVIAMSFSGDLMKRLIKLSLATATLALLATSANASVLIANPTSQPGYNTAPFGPGESLVVGFGANAPGYVLSGTGEIRLTSAPLDPGHAAVPFGDDSGHYMVVQSNESETI